LLARQEDLAVATLADLSDDVELLDLQLRASLAEQNALAAAVRLELFRVLGGGQRAGRRISIELRPSLFTSADVTKELKVVVQKVCEGFSASGER
jgi:hypothetical protein